MHGNTRIVLNFTKIILNFHPHNVIQFSFIFLFLTLLVTCGTFICDGLKEMKGNKMAEICNNNINLVFYVFVVSRIQESFSSGCT